MWKLEQSGPVDSFSQPAPSTTLFDRTQLRSPFELKEDKEARLEESVQRMIRVLEGQDDTQLPHGPFMSGPPPIPVEAPKPVPKAPEEPMREPMPMSPRSHKMFRGSHTPVSGVPHFTTEKVNDVVSRQEDLGRRHREQRELDRRRHVEAEMALMWDHPQVSQKVAEGVYGQDHVPIAVRSQQLIAQRQRDRQAAAQARDEAIGQHHTFTPQISAQARALDADRKGSALGTWDTWMVERDNRIRRAQEEQKKAEMEECPFQPQVDARSKELMQSHPDSGVDVVTRLHRDAIKRSQKREMLMQSGDPSRHRGRPDKHNIGARLHAEAVERDVRRQQQVMYRNATQLTGRPEAAALPFEATLRGDLSPRARPPPPAVRDLLLQVEKRNHRHFESSSVYVVPIE